MKRIKIKYILPLLFVIFTGCDNWLEVDPKSEIDTEKLFETTDGFTIAMNGIYANLSSANLYGGELKYYFVDALAHTYTITHSSYEPVESYDFSSTTVKRMIENIWSVAYNTIANCNSVLQQVEKKDSTFFPEAGKRMIKGEALSIRALLYFDLLRLFAPAPVVADEAAIPFYGELSNVPMPYKKTSEILSIIIDDLKTSKALQKDFDTSAEANIKFSDPHKRLVRTEVGFYGNQRRGRRMGYYATTALLAQVAQYAGNNELALENSMELIDKPDLIDLTSASKIEADKYDRLLTDGLILGLYNQDFEEDFSPSIFLIPNVEQIFGIDGDDFRKKCYLNIQGDQTQLAKFTILDDQVREYETKYTIPMFRLSQMYHIAIETLFDTNPEKALELFTTLRTKRGCKTALPDILTKNDLISYLVNDARREYMGEGQLFYLYKRLNHEIIDEEQGNITLTDEFVIPIPERETSMVD